VKSSVQQLSPTRVRISVEVPFAELEPDFQQAYKELAKQVRVPGVRPWKAPAKLLEARVGRSAIIEEVINAALPSRYGQAVADTEVHPLGQPDIDVTNKEYGQDLAFTAEVDVRPEITLPDLQALTVSVDSIEVTDDDVESELQSLRARFGSLAEVTRPVALEDVVTIDLSATADGEDLPGARAEGMSHEVGSGRLIAGLDDALVGLSVDESKVFTAQLATGEYAGQDAEVTVTVRSIKERELPEADDEFAQLASEFDTIDKLRDSLRERVSMMKRARQAEQIQNATLDALLEQVEVPLPEAIVQAQFDAAIHDALHGLDHDEARLAEVLTARGSSREEFESETRSAAEKDVKRQLLLDALADDLDIQVGQDALTERLLMTSRQYGIEPQQLFSYLQENNQLPAMFADVRRGLTVAAVVEAATVTDTDGNTIDTSEFFGRPAASDETDEADETDDTDESEEVEAQEASDQSATEPEHDA
jgi:trigger factor